MAGVGYHNDLTVIAYFAAHFGQPYVQLVVQEVVLSLVFAFLIGQAGVVRHPSLVEAVVLIAVKVGNLLSVTGEMDEYEVTGFAFSHQVLHLAGDACAGSLFVLEGHDILRLKAVIAQHGGYHGYVLIAVDGFPAGALGVSAYADNQGAFRGVHARYYEAKCQYQKCNVAFHIFSRLLF